ncbi:MAG: hypothetical protein IKX22_06480 [Prevotella sp.]|nr:hypothetical protein [Prevotella sp.]
MREKPNLFEFFRVRTINEKLQWKNGKTKRKTQKNSSEYSDNCMEKPRNLIKESRQHGHFRNDRHKKIKKRHEKTLFYHNVFIIPSIICIFAGNFFRKRKWKAIRVAAN